MGDIIETIGSSTIQHGPSNDRIYLMKLHADDAPDIIAHLDRIAAERGYSKVFVKVPQWCVNIFIAAGYELEASIPFFFPENNAACFMGKYFCAIRETEGQPQLVKDILAAAKAQEPTARSLPLPDGFSMRVALPEDAQQMATVYREVFATYPFPIHDPAFLQSAMAGNTIFFGIWQGNKIAALSSAEMDPSSYSVEMTDFATLPEYRGHGLALNLLQQMEVAVRTLGIRSLFTIARAYSFGMNITFARDGYSFGGTLTNNTNISGSLESMNVWYKPQPQPVQ